MDKTTVARAYSRAFYSLVEKNYEESRDSLSYLSSLITKSADAKKFLSHPSFSVQEKLKFITDIYGSKLNNVVERLVYILLEKKRINILDDIINELEKIYSEKHGLKFVQVISAAALSSEQTKRFSNAIARWLNKNVEIEFVVDESKVAGFVIVDGDRVLDNTILSELRAIKEYMLNF